MSGIAGVLNLDGAPVGRPVLEAMVAEVAFRGPDAQRIWIHGQVGFGHTLFATTDEAWHEQQPCSLDDGQVWIVADARVDGREDLTRDLEARGRAGVRGANDAELLLHAYHAWGDQMVDHLIGDFAFAIWDQPRRRLFCARDQFGVRPFFYAQKDGALVFSNTLDAVRRHPAISDDLNELFIADYLLFYYNQERDTTAYADIRRLPPGHALTCDGRTAQVHRYWQVTEKPEIRYRREQEYIDHFSWLVDRAVSDRLRTTHAGVLLSGGLDSSMVAATARKLLIARGEPFELHACTVVFDRIIRDEERHYAGVAGQALGIDVEFLAADDYGPYDRIGDLRMCEPKDEPHMALLVDMYRKLAARSRVALTGTDLDTLMAERPMVHVLGMLRRGRLVDLARDLQSTARWHGGIPRIGVRTLVREWRQKRRRPAPLPAWIDPGFAQRCALEQRWTSDPRPGTAASTHRLRPRVSRALMSTPWTYVFEGRDPGFMGVPLELRHPFADTRLVDYLLSIPLIPWCERKLILRRAARHMLPLEIINRRKAPLGGDPIRQQLRNARSSWLDSFEASGELEYYVTRRRIPPVTGEAASDADLHHLRPFTLDHWMRRRTTTRPQGVAHAEELSVG